MDRSEITRRYELATSSEWANIRTLLIEKVISLSKGSKTPEQIQGMLIILDEPNNWVKDFYAEKRRIDKEN